MCISVFDVSVATSISSAIRFLVSNWLKLTVVFIALLYVIQAYFCVYLCNCACVVWLSRNCPRGEYHTKSFHGAWKSPQMVIIPISTCHSYIQTNKFSKKTCFPNIHKKHNARQNVEPCLRRRRGEKQEDAKAETWHVFAFAAIYSWSLCVHSAPPPQRY